MGNPVLNRAIESSQRPSGYIDPTTQGAWQPGNGAQGQQYQNYGFNNPKTGFQAGPQDPRPQQPGFQQPGYQQPGYQQPPAYQPQVQGGQLTLDDVITRFGMSMGVVTVIAAICFFLMPLSNVTMMIAGASALAAFVVVLVLTFRPKVGPVGALTYAALEGVFVGTISKAFEYLYPGIVGQAVLGTIVAAAGVIIAYKFFGVRMSNRFRAGLAIAIVAYCVTAILGSIIMMFVNPQGFGMLGLIFAGVGVVLAVLALMSDLHDVQDAIRAGAPTEAAWGLVLGLTVTMVWLYINILRLLSYLRSN